VKDDLIAEGLIGTDEAGKGDYFGPLVCAACYVDSETYPILLSEGVRDSKRLSNSRAFTLARLIKANCPNNLIVILPAKYNQLYEEIHNVNRLLAWAHAKAIENLLARVDCQNVLSDQFGNENLIQNALQERGRQIKLIQRTKAEENIAVAAASILARDEFLRRLKALSEKFGLDLHPGAGAPTDESLVNFVKMHGREKLSEVAKLHFKNTRKVLR
jgi:ribonuclease HIII